MQEPITKKRFKEVNLVFFIMLTLYLIIMELLSRITSLNETALLVIGQCLMVSPFVVYLIVTRQNVAQAIRLKKIKVANVFLLIVFTYTMYPILGLINAISLLFTNNVIQQSVMDITKGKPFLYGVVLIALIPCIFEEFVYRGVLFNEYRKTSLWKAVLLSSFLFGLMHRNLNQFLYTFTMAFFLTLLLEATDSILAPMVVHFTLNGSSLALSYLLAHFNQANIWNANDMADVAPNLNEISNSKEVLVLTIIILGFISLFTLVLGALLMVGIVKIEGRYEVVKQLFLARKEGGTERIITWPLLLGMALCIVIILLTLL